jgi:RNA recognition motif-containing protein
LIPILSLFLYLSHFQAVGCDTPSTFLVVRGFGPFVSEDSIIELFRQFAVVKSAYLLRDAVTGISKGVAFVEFHTVDHAVHTLQQTSLGQIHLDSSPLKIMFAKESFRVGQRMKVPAISSDYISVVLLIVQF